MLELHELDEITLELDGPKLLSGIATKTAAGLAPSALVRRAQELWSMHLQPLRGNYEVRNDKGKRRLNAPAEGTIRSLIVRPETRIESRKCPGLEPGFPRDHKENGAPGWARDSLAPCHA